jgi:hypothetical protein
MFASDTNGIESPTCSLIVWLTIIADPASVSTFEWQVDFFNTEVIARRSTSRPRSTVFDRVDGRVAAVDE